MFLLPECYRERVGKGKREARSFHAPHPNRARFWERFAKCLADALPPTGERLVEALTFRSPCLWPHRFWKRFAKCLAIALPSTGERLVEALTVPQPRAFLEALCQVLGHCPAFGARTGRALQDCSALSRWRSDCFAIRGGAGAQAAQPMAERARHWLSRQWHPIGFAFGLCARSFAVRAPCAHQRKSNASHKA